MTMIDIPSSTRAADSQPVRPWVPSAAPEPVHDYRARRAEPKWTQPIADTHPYTRVHQSFIRRSVMNKDLEQKGKADKIDGKLRAGFGDVKHEIADKIDKA